MSRVKWALCSVLVLGLGSPAPDVEAQVRRVEVVRIGDAFLGVTLEEVGKDEVTRLKLPEERGALVASVEADSPAEKAGIKKDDVVLRYQGEIIHTAAQLARLIRETPHGRTVSLDVSRGGATQQLKATLAERERARPFAWRFGPDFNFEMPELPHPPDTPLLQWRSRAPRKLGIEYQEIGDQLAKYFKLTEDRGVLVTHVDENGAAEKAGMKAGDVILKVASKSVRDGGDLRDALANVDADEEVAITVQRDGRPQDLKLRLSGTSKRRRGSSV
jgi:S1-C subfamily serine protease